MIRDTAFVDDVEALRIKNKNPLSSKTEINNSSGEVIGITKECFIGIFSWKISYIITITYLYHIYVIV